MDRFAELKAFCLVPAGGGSSPAARQLGLATSSVTRLVDARRVLEQLDAADDAVAAQGGEIKGVLRVAAPVSFATLHITPSSPNCAPATRGWCSTCA